MFKSSFSDYYVQRSLLPRASGATLGSPQPAQSSMATTAIGDNVVVPMMNVEQAEREDEEQGVVLEHDSSVAQGVGDVTVNIETTVESTSESCVPELERKARFSLTRCFFLLIQGIENFFPPYVSN